MSGGRLCEHFPVLATTKRVIVARMQARKSSGCSTFLQQSGWYWE